MIEMNEQFQQQFGAALAQLRALITGLTRSADNARGEAKALSANSDNDAAITAYEVAHAYWTAADRVRPVLGSFEDADRVAASLMEGLPPVTAESSSGNYAEVVQSQLGELLTMPVPGGAVTLRVLHDGDGAIGVGLLNDVRYGHLAATVRAGEAFKARVEFLESELQRLNDALDGRGEDLEDLIDLAIRLATSTREKERADREHERAESLAKVTTAAAKLLGVTTLPDILVALERLVTGKPFDFKSLPQGSLIAGEWVSAAGSDRKIYVGRFDRLDADGPVIEYVCECATGAENGHIVSTKLNRDTVRLPTADEIIAFGKLARKTGLLRLPTDSDE